MGKDIDKNITRQLWERLKNTFTRNDIIPVENGGTGGKNLLSILPDITNNTKYVKKFQTLLKMKNLTLLFLEI